MQVSFDPYTKTYTFKRVTETELQIFNRAFEYDRPYRDVPELSLYSKLIQGQLCEANEQLQERYPRS